MLCAGSAALSLESPSALAVSRAGEAPHPELLPMEQSPQAQGTPLSAHGMRGHTWGCHEPQLLLRTLLHMWLPDAKEDLPSDMQSQAEQARTRWVTLSHAHPQMRCPERCIHRRRGGVCSEGCLAHPPMQTEV